MTYHANNVYRKYVQGYDFLSFAKNFGNKYGKRLINKGVNSVKRFSKIKYGKALKQEGLKFGKIAGKQFLERGAQAAGDKIGDLIADQISSIGKKLENNESQEEQEDIMIPPEIRQQIIDDLRLF